ncbi:DUF5131 family protein [Myxococcota bacterium]
MAVASKIEWTDASWNPVRGCTKVSPGCKNCYACTFAERFRGVPGHPYEQGFDLRLVPEKLEEPLSWRRPRMVFVNSMSDLFHEKISEDYILAVAGVMERARWHTYQVLTKRSERMTYLLTGKLSHIAHVPHIWWGVSVENEKHGLPRVRDLQKTLATNRFLSLEPLLDPMPTLPLDGIDWVIVGGESGPGARPMHPDWARSVRDQCLASGTRFFFKQWGAWAPADQHEIPPGSRRATCWRDVNGTRRAGPFPGAIKMVRVGKKAAGRLLDGVLHDYTPQLIDGARRQRRSA